MQIRGKDCNQIFAHYQEAKRQINPNANVTSVKSVTKKKICVTEPCAKKKTYVTNCHMCIGFSSCGSS